MKTFLLGCGGQKCGTTWLSQNLLTSEEYWNGSIKEWRFWKHYFNSSSRHKFIKKLKESPKVSPHNRWRINALEHPDVFLEQITSDFIANKELKVLGDMTPNNGTLNPEQLSSIKNYFENRGIQTKVVLIMRDPFERIWSETRMKIQNQNEETLQKDEKYNCDQLLKRYKLDLVERKTRYEIMITNIEKVFSKEDINYQFSEQLFNQGGLDKITNYLHMQNIIADLDSPNPSPKQTTIPSSVKEEIIDYYKSTYIKIHQQFGPIAKESWRESYMYLDI